MTASKPTLVAVDGRAHLRDLPLVLDHPQVREGGRQGVVGVDRLGHLLVGEAGLAADLVDQGRDVAVGVAHDPQGDRTGVLGQGVGQLVDVPRRDAELGLQLFQRGASTHPELPVASVGEELLGVAPGQWAGVNDRFMPAAVGSAARVQDQHGVGLAVGAEAGEVREGRVRSEGVVTVVGAHLQPPRGDDQPLTRVCRADRLASRGGIRSNLGALGKGAGARGPSLADEGPERLGGGAGAVVALLLLFAHRAMVPRCRSRVSDAA
jgi:hypothetical protein